MSVSRFPKLRILWIEDQHSEYDPLLDDLQNLVGHEHVAVVHTLDQGRSKLQSQAFDLLLLDLMLPQNENEYRMELIHMDAGQRLLRELRENTDWKTPPTCDVVVLTARGEPHALSDVRQLLGSSGHLLQKPVLVEEIVRVVSETLQRTDRPAP